MPSYALAWADAYRPAMFGICVQVDGASRDEAQRSLVMAGMELQRAATKAGSGNVVLNPRVVTEDGVVYITVQAVVPVDQGVFPSAIEIDETTVLGPTIHHPLSAFDY